MNTAFYKQGIGLVMFVIGLLGYLRMVSDNLSIETINFAQFALFVLAIGAAIFVVLQLRKQEKIEKKIDQGFSIPKFNKTPKKANLFFFLFSLIILLVVLIFLLTNYTFPREDMYMILFTNLLIMYGLSFVLRILI